jgi:2-dehydro-3-deoxyglucarate aldolase/4-hydroxy-2-oxoheptanedioate aldolase
MENAHHFREKLARGQICLGTGITYGDATVTEALCGVLDFLWIDMEHAPLSLADVQAHVMATKGSDTVPLVRVPWNDPVLVKPVLDLGAAGVILPMVRTPEEARKAVAACLYPPEGIRGFGPRRPSRYGQLGGPAFCAAANRTVLPIVQIEHAEAVENIDAILATPGLASIVLGPNDLSGSLGHMGNPGHPDVDRAIDHVVARARKMGIPVGVGTGDDPVALATWARRGVQWLTMGCDCTLLVRAARQVAGELRKEFGNLIRGTE